MFSFKHEIELVTKEKVWLFGEDYYNDKKVFWLAHQSTLNNLHAKVNATGFPLKIIYLETKTTVHIVSKLEFDIWIDDNQP